MVNSYTEITSHYWICASSFIDSSIVMSRSKEGGLSTITIFDSFGNTSNKIEIETSAVEPIVLDAEALLGSVSTDKGIRHAHLQIEHSPDVSMVVRFSSLESGCFGGALSQCDQKGGALFPFTADPIQNTLLYLVNPIAESSSVRLRLYFKNRAPETFITIPPYGVKVILVEEEFKEILAGEEGQMGYIRVIPRSGEICAGVIERKGPLEGEKYELGVMA